MIEMVWLPDTGVEETVFVHDATEAVETAIRRAIEETVDEQQILTLPQVSTTPEGARRTLIFRAVRIVSYRRLP